MCTAGIHCVPACGDLTRDIQQLGDDPAGTTSTTAVAPIPAELPKKQLLPAVDGIPPGSTAEALPSNLPDAGIIDPNSVNDSGTTLGLFPAGGVECECSHPCSMLIHLSVQLVL